MQAAIDKNVAGVDVVAEAAMDSELKDCVVGCEQERTNTGKEKEVHKIHRLQTIRVMSSPRGTSWPQWIIRSDTILHTAACKRSEACGFKRAFQSRRSLSKN